MVLSKFLSVVGLGETALTNCALSQTQYQIYGLSVSWPNLTVLCVILVRPKLVVKHYRDNKGESVTYRAQCLSTSTCSLILRCSHVLWVGSGDQDIAFGTLLAGQESHVQTKEILF